jgi:hypothetical protein
VSLTPEPALDSVPDSSFPRPINRWILLACIAFTLYTAIYPFARAFFRVEVDYNEGWNIYNAARLVNHQFLYPVAYGWQTVNYPMVSFAVMAALNHFTHEYLFTARMVSLLSLLGCCTLVGLIVHCLAGKHAASRTAAFLAALLCLATFCTNADPYVGMDDPQLFGHFFFLFAFFLYLRDRTNFAAVTLAAAVFVLAGSIKHNPLDFPLAVLIDLTLLNGVRGLPRALWFALVGLLLAGLSVYLNLHFGGPYFLATMLAPRVWTFGKVVDSMINVLGPLLIPMVFALIASVFLLRDPRRRIAGILFFAALIIGSAFGGGLGVFINTFFSCIFAMVIVLGIVASDLLQGRYAWASRCLYNLPLRACFLPALFGWMMIPAIVAGIWNPIAMLRQTVASEREFDTEVDFLKQRPAPVLCESLLRCYFAGQPYVYDPFNATRLIHFHLLDPALVVNGLDSHAYSAVQFDGGPLTDIVATERFSPEILAAIRRNYHSVLQGKDASILIPNTPSSLPR